MLFHGGVGSTWGTMGSDVAATLRAVGWFLAAWLVVSVIATFVIVRLFRVRARANEQLAADGRRADWEQATEQAPERPLAGQ